MRDLLSLIHSLDVYFLLLPSTHVFAPLQNGRIIRHLNALE